MKPTALLPALALTSAPGLAQSIDWATFLRDDTRISAPTSLVLGDTREKDYAHGDLDRDGWIDLVVVRKQPFTTSGRFPNVLLMNRGGVLTDETAQYASASDVPGDQGFLTPTNDRDVVIVDVDLDGWLDVVTSTTLSPGQPKAISHPRVYMNLGEVGGQWQGLEYQAARIPDWGTYPNMCGVAAGDVTGDGYPDLYFSHYEQQAQVDLNDRLLINDGTGHFTDESAARMTAAMRGSSFGTSAVITDMNLDGVNDVVSVSGAGQTGGLTRSSIAYNNPSNEGFFNILQEPYTGAPYHVTTGDLNGDGRPDMVLSDDSDDRYLLNTGTDVFGRATFGPARTFGTDDGFGSNSTIVDVDGDGFPEAIICDVDVDIGGCDRRMHLFHNRGGTVGGDVTLREERAGSDYGAQGLPALRGTHDVAVFDVDGDGDQDLVVGLCSGTRVYLNQKDSLGVAFCTAVGNSTGLPALLRVRGSVDVVDNDITLAAEAVPVGQFGIFLVSRSEGFLANPGGSAGNLCLGTPLGRFVGPGQVVAADAQGTFSIPVDLTALPLGSTPVGAAAGDSFSFQAWFRDSVLGIPTSNFTGGVTVTFR